MSHKLLAQGAPARRPRVPCRHRHGTAAIGQDHAPPKTLRTAIPLCLARSTGSARHDRRRSPFLPGPVPAPLIVDEVQHAPELLSYIKERVDARRQTPGQYLLTGSQNLLLMQQVSETLAGRAAVLRLLPLAHRETDGRRLGRLPWELTRARTGSLPTQETIWRSILRGGYPEIALNNARDAELWHRSYVQTYLERDVRTLRQVGDLTQFQGFLRTLAARSGQLLHLSALSRDLGVAVNTAKAWLSVLEASYQVVVVRPWFANTGKRLVKTPKVYFTDTGRALGGALFETAVLAEITRTLWHRGDEPCVRFPAHIGGRRRAARRRPVRDRRPGGDHGSYSVASGRRPPPDRTAI